MNIKLRLHVKWVVQTVKCLVAGEYTKYVYTICDSLLG